MRFACLGSGSKGNATVIQTAQSTILVDCGFSAKEAVSRLQGLGLEPQHIDALLVTHEHGDHIRGISVFSRRYQIPVWASRGTSQYFTDEDLSLNIINVHKTFKIGEIAVTPVPVPHDAREPCQFIFRDESSCFGMLTDVGSITSHIVEEYSECKALLLEFNHDSDMLRNGEYSAALKTRVGGSLGHLNNTQSCDLLASLLPGELQFVVAGHLSEKNNSSALVEEALSQTVMPHGCDYAIATQSQASNWYQLDQLC